MQMASLLALAKVAGPVSSGIFAGYTWSLSDSAVPAVLSAPDEASKLRGWRIQYIQGFLLAVPCTLTNILSWLSLALSSPSSSWARYLFLIATLGTGTGTMFAWTFLRSTNGALSMRTEKLAGRWPGYFQIPLSYAFGEKASTALEKKLTTEQLIERWSYLNLWRSALLIGGTVAGCLGLVLI